MDQIHDSVAWYQKKVRIKIQFCLPLIVKLNIDLNLLPSIFVHVDRPVLEIQILINWSKSNS